MSERIEQKAREISLKFGEQARIINREITVRRFLQLRREQGRPIDRNKATELVRAAKKQELKDRLRMIIENAFDLDDSDVQDVPKPEVKLANEPSYKMDPEYVLALIEGTLEQYRASDNEDSRTEQNAYAAC